MTAVDEAATIGPADGKPSVDGSTVAAGRATRLLAAVGLLTIAVAALVLYNLTQGEPDHSLSTALDNLLRTGPIAGDIDSILIREVRLPRVLMALLAGSALGLAGVLLQDALRNPLADPTLLGVAQGAGFVIALASIYPELVPPLPTSVLCFIGGTLAGSVVLVLSRRSRNPVRVVLAGAMVSILFATLSSVVILITPRTRGLGIIEYFRFVIGSFIDVTWDSIGAVLPWFLLAVPLGLASARIVNLLSLGDEAASSLGLNPGRARIGLMILSMALVTPYVAQIGPIGFVALFAPHVSRSLIASSDALRVMITSAFAGALMLLTADTAARLLFFPFEVPAGVFTFLIVGPLALVIVGRLGRSR
ncbi:MAG: iron ABC transporter permease [Actinomycetota bacterium]